MTVQASDLGAAVASPSPTAGWRAALRQVSVPLLQIVAIPSLLYVLLEAWRRDLRVPLAFTSDTLWYLMQSKSTVDNGWWWWNPRLGAPIGFDEVAYPSNSTVDQALVWLVSRAAPDAIAAVNLTWVLLVTLSGLSATWCLRRLGISTPGAAAAGMLFALSPYALYRNVDHFALVIYLVPFACTAALWLASGEPHRAWDRTARAVVLIGCALLGFNYVYYAFFGSFALLAGAGIGYAARRDRRILASGALCIAIIAGSTFVNLAPSFYSWYRNGPPLVLRDKVPAESETFGLKIRQLVSPVYPHRFTPFNTWVEREAAAKFPNDNENWNARLGLVGALGFVALLALLFIPDHAARQVSPLLRGASRLTLAALLLATVGGFGSVFNLIVGPDIRAYNRISPFIAFFSLLAVVVVLDRLFSTTRARAVAAATLLLVGVADQGQATQRLNEAYPGIAAELSDLRAFVGTLERALPVGAMVFQLPFRTYMNESDFGRMNQYDLFKPYLASQTLRFSYPALSNEQVRWQQAAARLDPGTLAGRLSTMGFSAVLVDRYGYEDAGAAVTTALLDAIGDAASIGTSDRFAAFDIRGAANRVDSAAGERPMQPVPLTLSLRACPGQPMMAIDQIESNRPPFAATGVRLQASGVFKVSGWAVDHAARAPASGLDVVIDQQVFPGTYGLHRKDVGDYFGRTIYRDTGFIATIPATALTAGEHWLSVRVVAAAGACYFQSAGIRVIVD